MTGRRALRFWTVPGRLSASVPLARLYLRLDEGAKKQGRLYANKHLWPLAEVLRPLNVVFTKRIREPRLH